MRCSCRQKARQFRLTVAEFIPHSFAIERVLHCAGIIDTLAPGGVSLLHIRVRPHPLPGVRIASSSSSVRGQSLFRRRDSARSARSLPPV